jgi:hypothetical protein
VARSGAPVEGLRTTVAVLVEATIAPSARGSRWFTVTADDSTIETREGLESFDDWTAMAARFAREPLDEAEAARCLERAAREVEPHARSVFAPQIDAMLARGNDALARSREFVLDAIDEAPVDHRAALATRGAAVMDATRALVAPTLVLDPRAVVIVRQKTRAARWRLSSDAGWATLETEARSGAERVLPRCDGCGRAAARWALCAGCVALRCGHCARRCARCRRAACARCAPSRRCPSCGLFAVEAVES